MQRLNGYEVTIKDCPSQGTLRINAFTANKAKYQASLAIQDAGYQIRWTDLRVRKLKKPADSGVTHCAQYRGVPFVRPGMLCRLGGKVGRITGGGYGGMYFRFATPQGFSCVFHPQGDPVQWLNEDGSPFVGMVDRTWEGDGSGEGDPEITVILPCGHTERFFEVGLSDEEYIRRAGHLKEVA